MIQSVSPVWVLAAVAMILLCPAAFAQDAPPSVAPAASPAAAPTSVVPAATPTPKTTAENDKLTALANQLSSDDADQRLVAASALATYADPRALEVLRAALADKAHPGTRIAVLKAFKGNRDNRALPETIACLDAAEPEVQAAAKDTLAALDSDAAIDALTARLQEAEVPPSARAAIAEVLGARRAFRAAPALIPLLDDADAHVQQAALAALQRITGQKIGNAPATWRAWWENNKNADRVRMLEDVIARQEDEIKSYRSQLALLWMKLLHEAANGGAVVYFDGLHCGLPDVQVFAAGEIARLKPDRAVTELLKETGNASPAVRLAVVRALGQLASPAALDALLAALNDADALVRQEAALGLGRIKAEAAVPKLVALLAKANDEALSAAAARSLGVIGDAAAVGDLIAVLADVSRDKALREEAATALGKFNDPRVVDPLIAALRDKTDQVRWAAVNALGHVSLPNAKLVPILAPMATGDPNPQVRQVVVAALGRLGGDECVPPLLQALSDADTGVAELALTTLLHLGGPRVAFFQAQAEGLIEAGHADVAVRLLTNAIQTVGQSGVAPPDLRPLQLLLADTLFRQSRWSEASPMYLELLQSAAKDDPDQAMLIDRGATCMTRLNDTKGLLTLYQEARQRVPARSAEWWQATEQALNALFQAKQYDAVAGAADALLKKEGDAVDAARRARLTDWRDKAIAARGAAGGDAELQSLMSAFVKDETARQAAIPGLMAMKERAVPALIQYGLRNPDLTISQAAVTLLESITGHLFEFTTPTTAAQRAQAIDKWIAWWQSAANAPGENGPAPAPANGAAKQ